MNDRCLMELLIQQKMREAVSPIADAFVKDLNGVRGGKKNHKYLQTARQQVGGEGITVGGIAAICLIIGWAYAMIGPKKKSDSGGGGMGRQRLLLHRPVAARPCERRQLRHAARRHQCSLPARRCCQLCQRVRDVSLQPRIGTPQCRQQHVDRASRDDRLQHVGTACGQPRQRTHRATRLDSTRALERRDPADGRSQMSLGLC